MRHATTLKLATAGILGLAFSASAAPITFGTGDLSWTGANSTFSAGNTAFTVTDPVSGLAATFTFYDWYDDEANLPDPTDAESATFDFSNPVVGTEGWSTNGTRIGGDGNDRIEPTEGFGVVFNAPVDILAFEYDVRSGTNTTWSVGIGEVSSPSAVWGPFGDTATVGVGGISDPGTVPAGTSIYFAIGSDAPDRANGFDSLTVEVIPEPASLSALAGLGALGLRRRRA